MMATWSETEVISHLIKAGAALDLQNKVMLFSPTAAFQVMWKGVKQMIVSIL